MSVFNPETGAPLIFKQRMVPALLKISFANRLLKLTWSAYFDGFLSLSEAASAKRTDMCVASLFSFLGWRLSEDKLVPFSFVCKVLGVEVRKAKLGLALDSNNRGGVEELTFDIEAIYSNPDSCPERTARS